MIKVWQAEWNSAVRSKNEFLRAWISALDESDSKSLALDPAGKKLSGSPIFYVFVDMDYYCLLSGMEWTSALQLSSLVVPKGFVTDFASVPRLFWSLLPPMGRYGYAALFHDFVYWQQLTTRAQADGFFRALMTELCVPPWKREVMFWGLRLFGSFAWKSNRARKLAGERRVLKIIPSDPEIHWMEWKMKPEVFE